jgi:hypothetical protein
MPDSFNIPENVINAGIQALIDHIEGRNSSTEEDVRVIVQACLNEWGAREERVSGLETEQGPQRRLVFPWEPVEGDESWLCK